MSVFQHTVFTRAACAKTRNPGDLPAETETGVGSRDGAGARENSGRTSRTTTRTRVRTIFHHIYAHRVYVKHSVQPTTRGLTLHNDRLLRSD